MLSITQRMKKIQEELPMLICILKEGINLLEEITPSENTSPSKKLDYFRYLFLYHKRIQILEKNFLELKSELVMIDQQIETLLEYGEGCYPQVKTTLKSMLEELQNLPQI